MKMKKSPDMPMGNDYIEAVKSNFKVDPYIMRYSDFTPRLFNFCLSIGMKPHQIMPSRAFCSDENQGYPIILIAKHFSTFPFNHGRVGGIVATGRHAPHANHGEGIVILQASHVGFEPETGEFGVYRRLQTKDHLHSTDCGAICGVMAWYQNELAFAAEQIKLEHGEDGHSVIIDNLFLNSDRNEGLFLNIDKIIQLDKGQAKPLACFNTSTKFRASETFVARVAGSWPWQQTVIGTNLFPDLYYFRRTVQDSSVASYTINQNLIDSMPIILSSRYPALAAAQVNVQKEFERTHRTIVKERAYRDKNVVFISGIHIDVSPREGQIFPLTKYVPWAAYVQDENGLGYTIEQDELYNKLMSQSTENPFKIDLTEAINSMKQETEIKIEVD